MQDRLANFITQLTSRTHGGRTRAANGLQHGPTFLVCVVTAKHAAHGERPKAFAVAMECGISEQSVRRALRRARAAGVHPATLTVEDLRPSVTKNGQP